MSQVDKVYVVMGSTGEYSDRSEWPVRAFLSESRAQREVKALEEQVRPLNAKEATGSRWDDCPVAEWHERDAWLKAQVPLDPNFDMDYTGTRYYYIEVEVGE